MQRIGRLPVHGQLLEPVAVQDLVGHQVFQVSSDIGSRHRRHRNSSHTDGEFRARPQGFPIELLGIPASQEWFSLDTLSSETPRAAMASRVARTIADDPATRKRVPARLPSTRLISRRLRATSSIIRASIRRW